MIKHINITPSLPKAAKKYQKLVSVRRMALSLLNRARYKKCFVFMLGSGWCCVNMIAEKQAEP